MNDVKRGGRGIGQRQSEQEQKRSQNAAEQHSSRQPRQISARQAGFTHKREDPAADLPPSLYRAFDEFVVARAIRNLRGQTKKHCSMLVNVSRFVPVQRTVRDFLSVYEKKLREAVKANYAMPEKSSSQNQYMKALRAAFDEEYVDCGFSWDQVKAALFSRPCAEIGRASCRERVCLAV